MIDGNAWVVRTKSKPGIWPSIQDGKARIGWSYADRLDIRRMRSKRERGEDLDEREQRAWRCHRFESEVEEGDYLVYPNQPERGQFVIAQVEGEYGYLEESDGLNGDFRSYRPCTPVTSSPVDKRDAIVPPTIRTKLGLPGRLNRMHGLTGEFEQLLDHLEHKGIPEGEENDVRIGRIAERFHRDLPELLQKEFPNHDLSRRLCTELFDAMGYGVELQEGPGEHGSDLVVTIGSPLLPESATSQVGVQVASYEDEVSKSTINRKLDQLLEGWDVNQLDYGVIFTTGEATDAAFDRIEDHNESDDRPVKLLDGRDVADLFLRHMSDELSASLGATPWS